MTKAKQLTAMQVKKAAPGSTLYDGGGLMLQTNANGASKWVVRVKPPKWTGRRRQDIGLGPLALVSLAEAREAALEVRKAIRQGRDVVQERKDARKTVPTFEEAAKLVQAEHKKGWRSARYATQWLETLERYAFPRLGKLPVNRIDGPLIRDVLAEIWTEKAETARKIRQRISTVLDFAYSKGWRETEAPRTVSKGLARQPRDVQHHAAMEWRELPDFIRNMGRTLKTSETILLAIEFLTLTAARSGEVRHARWHEIDFDRKVWAVPASRAKTRREHRVPLSPRAVQVLQRMKKLRRTDDPDALIFQGQKKDKALSDMSLSMPLRRAGIKCTIHGMRSAFRIWASEAGGVPHDVAELCLAHAQPSKVVAAYQRSDLLERRRRVMTAWADHLAGKPPAGNVSDLAEARRERGAA